MTETAQFKSTCRTFLRLVLVMLLVVSTRAAFAEGEVSVSEQEAIQVLLQDLDHQCERLEKLQESLPTKTERAAEEVRVAALKDRRLDLRKKFNQERYDALKTDVALETARLSAELAKATGASGVSEPATQPSAAVMPPKIDDVRAASGEKINNPQIQAMLASLETDISELEKKVNQMPVSSERDAAKRRVQLFRDRSVDLTNAFDKARYDILRTEVKSEWTTVMR